MWCFILRYIVQLLFCSVRCNVACRGARGACAGLGFKGSKGRVRVRCARTYVHVPRAPYRILVPVPVLRARGLSETLPGPNSAAAQADAKCKINTCRTSCVLVNLRYRVRGHLYVTTCLLSSPRARDDYSLPYKVSKSSDKV